MVTVTQSLSGRPSSWWPPRLGRSVTIVSPDEEVEEDEDEEVDESRLPAPAAGGDRLGHVDRDETCPWTIRSRTW